MEVGRNLEMQPKKEFLVINCGTSSVKISLFSSVNDTTPLFRLWNGHLKGIFSSSPSLEIGTEKRKIISLSSCGSYRKAILTILDCLEKDQFSLSLICKVGHRVVHGGKEFINSILLTDFVLQKLQILSSLAPLHNPPALEGISVAKELFSDIPQIAVFDTTFYSNFPPHVALYPIPLELAEEHQIKRYGFHGISHQYLWKRYITSYPEKKKDGKIISLHLGSGCSLTAIKASIPIDTTMGFTPLDGLMMATRSGSIDPAIVAFLAEKENKSAAEIITILNQQSGLLGVSGETGDMQALLSLAESNERAKLAIDMFLHNLIKGVGSLIAILGGVDAFLFTGGIGENSPFIRSYLLSRFSWINVLLSESKNDECFSLSFGEMRRISSEDSSVQVFVVATDENGVIAEEIRVQ